MERDITVKLKNWKESTSRKPLIITGIRQCGKTYAMTEFGKKEYKNVAYFNFEKDKTLNTIFEVDLNVKRIIEKLSMLNGKPITPGETLLIFDEIQACSRAITSLKYFCEDMPEQHVMCAGSLLGVMLAREGTSYPVGKAERLQMYPMTFSEFLRAYNKGFYEVVDTSLKKGMEVPEGFASVLEDALKTYYVLGGMPEVVDTWLKTNDLEKTEKIQDTILNDYKDDFAKHAPKIDVPKLGLLWDSVPKQLAKENNKFQYSDVKAGKRARDFENPLMWLIDAGLVYKVDLVENIEKPLSHFIKDNFFKIYMADIGLLRRKAGIDAETIISDDKDYKIFKGPLAENYVLNELKAKGMKPYFWRSGNTAEVDFVIEDKGRIIPIEVKATTHTKAKSFSLFCKRYSPELGLKFSMKNVGKYMTEKTNTYGIPLYLIWKLQDYLVKEKTFTMDSLADRMAAATKKISDEKKRLLKIRKRL